MGLDSLDVVECVVEIEDEFAIEVNDKDVDRLTTVASVVEYVCDQLSSVVDQYQRPDIEFKEHMVKKRPVN